MPDYHQQCDSNSKTKLSKYRETDFPQQEEGEKGEQEDYHYIPPENQRGFSAGYRKHRVTFVPAETVTSQTQRTPSSTTSLLGDRYLSIVLGKKRQLPPTPRGEGGTQDSGTNNVQRDDIADGTKQTTTTICEICKQPLEPTSSVGDGDETGDAATTTTTTTTTRTNHETSIAHQVCLAHSHPPSHLDREHVGLKYLAEYGWDPDSRTGLGARQEGIRVPIKAKEKRDTAGLGVVSSGTAAAEEDEEEAGIDGLVGWKKSKSSSTAAMVKKENKVTKVNAKEVRRIEDDKRKRAEKLRHSFYGEDLSKYLGPDG